MAKSSVSFLYLPLLLLLFFSGKSEGGGESCQYVSVIGGGCPQQSECVETCRPCYRGVGIIKPYCVPPSGPTPYWECHCAFENGAPCPPFPPPQCPRPWPPAASSTLNSSSFNNV